MMRRARIRNHKALSVNRATLAESNQEHLSRRAQNGPFHPGISLVRNAAECWQLQITISTTLTFALRFCKKPLAKPGMVRLSAQRCILEPSSY